MTFINLLGWLLAAFWLTHSAIMLHFLLKHQLCELAENSPPLQQFPKLAIIVPARDEARSIRAALSSLLKLDYPEYQVIAIDDRSTDATGRIMDELAAASNRLKIIHIDKLPEGWLGKTHAMHKASELAECDYLIFTDGDVIYQTDALQNILRYVIAQNLDHLALLPRLLPGSYAENSVTHFMGMVFVLSCYPFMISRPQKYFYAGVGPFNLIRKDTYQAIGGFDKLRLEVVEDMALGREVKAHGFKSQLLLANEYLQFRWQTGVDGLIRGIEKNSFAAIDYSLPRLFIILMIFGLIFFLPYWATVSLPIEKALGYGAALICLHAILGYWGQRAQVGWRITFALPFSACVTLFALCRSAILTLKQGGVYWRDTFYSLALLKKR